MGILKTFEIDENNVNLFELSYDDIHVIEKRDLVNQIEKMKGKVVIGSRGKDLCHQIEKLTERLNDVVATNEKITSELLIVKNVNSNLEKRVATLEKLQAKAEPYSRKKNKEISGIPNDFLDNDLEEKVIEICKGSDMEGCHHLPLGRNNTSKNKQVIVNFVNRKRSELMLCLNKNINSKSKVYINNWLCPYYCFL